MQAKEEIRRVVEEHPLLSQLGAGLGRMAHAAQVLRPHVGAVDDIKVGRATNQLLEDPAGARNADVYVTSSSVDDDSANKRSIPPFLFHDRWILQSSRKYLHLACRDAA